MELLPLRGLQQSWASNGEGSTPFAVHTKGSKLQTETVLLVEADSISTQLLSFSLQREGYDVVAAQSAHDAMRLAREKQVDIILSEVLLPDIDGRELCRHLRSDWNTQRIPIVLATSLGANQDRLEGLEAGADDYLVKPYDVRELMIRLRRLISTYSNCAHLHPITRLPGGHIISDFVRKTCIEEQGSKWALLKIDINHFKSYNRLYGYDAGDRVLSMTADLLRKVVHQGNQKQPGSGHPEFVGHDGMDDFIAVVPAERAGSICLEIIEAFDSEVLSCYPAEHRDSKYQVLIDRRGNTQLMPRLALSVGVVTYDLCENLSYLQLREAAEAVLSRARAQEESFAYVNRRRLTGELATRSAKPQHEKGTV